MMSVKITQEWFPGTETPDPDECNSDCDILFITKEGINPVRFGGVFESEGNQIEIIENGRPWGMEDIVAWCYVPEGSTIAKLVKEANKG